MDNWSRYIIHVDMDAFYAAVEQRDNPELLGRPVVIGGHPDSRGVVSTASYEARQFGIRSAMPMTEAYRRCPHAVFLPGNHHKYHQVSQEILKVYQEYTPDIEPLALDEAFLDVTHSYKLFGGVLVIGREIKNKIKQNLDLDASVGVSYNKFLAKLASDLEKPDGFTVITPENALNILDGLPIGRLWGVGDKTAAQLIAIGLDNIGKVRRVSLEVLEKHVGSMALQLYQLSRGIDHRLVQAPQKPKSVGNETTFHQDVALEQCLPALLELSLEVGRRLRKIRLAARTVTLKVRYHDFRTITRAYTYPELVDTDQEIYNAVKSLFLDNVQGGKIRLVGVTVSNLDAKGEGQSSLFVDEGHVKLEKLNVVVDKLSERFGDGSVTRGTLMTKSEVRR